MWSYYIIIHSIHWFAIRIRAVVLDCGVFPVFRSRFNSSLARFSLSFISDGFCVLFCISCYGAWFGSICWFAVGFYECECFFFTISRSLGFHERNLIDSKPSTLALTNFFYEHCAKRKKLLLPNEKNQQEFVTECVLHKNRLLSSPWSESQPWKKKLVHSFSIIFHLLHMNIYRERDYWTNKHNVVMRTSSFSGLVLLNAKTVLAHSLGIVWKESR